MIKKDLWSSKISTFSNHINNNNNNTYQNNIHISGDILFIYCISGKVNIKITNTLNINEFLLQTNELLKYNNNNKEIIIIDFKYNDINTSIVIIDLYKN